MGPTDSSAGNHRRWPVVTLLIQFLIYKSDTGLSQKIELHQKKRMIGSAAPG
jgi:hypothetical protein